MKVTRVCGEVKLSKAVHFNEQGEATAWKSLDLGAEASINAKEDWQEAQKALYADLATQLKELFTNGSKKPTMKPPESKRNPGKGQPETKMCPIHNVLMQRRKKNGQVWYSHKTKDAWCRGDT